VLALLFKVADRIYRARGYDLSNITYVQGDTGWVVFDPLVTVETSGASLDPVTQHLGKGPALAVVYSHSHVDHIVQGTAGRRPGRPHRGNGRVRTRSERRSGLQHPHRDRAAAGASHDGLTSCLWPAAGFRSAFVQCL
jgi:glyoxylase-like metal-dependent hydrolase (beta-lactamase superfamily II)